MADSQDNQNPPSEDDVQKQFWEEMDKRMDSKLKPITDAISKFLKPSDPKPEPDTSTPEPVKKDDKPPQGTSRTGGPRVTLSSLIADAVFGPKKD